jgi:phosphate transport system protein
MPRETFDRELIRLKEEVLLLGSRVELAVNDAVDALRHGDHKTARKVRLEDHIINEKRYAIEQEALTVIATQQPLARDLRLLAAILEIITELERIGDYAKGIANITLRLDEKADIPKSEFKQMAKIGLEMLKKSLDAFMSGDVSGAKLIPAQDDEVDDLYNRVYRKLIKQMINDPASIDSASHLMWAAHNLERLADRVTNICERIVFVSTGEIIEVDQSDDEMAEKGKK